MGNPLLHLLKIHGWNYDEVDIISINEDQTINILDKNGIEYKIDGNEKTIIENENKVSSKKTRGWHFMKEFVDENGDVYVFGKKVK